MKKLLCFFASITCLIGFLPANAFSASDALSTLAENSVQSTGQLESFLVPPEEYLTAMQALSVLVAEELKYEKNRWQDPNDKKKKKGVQELAKELLDRLPENARGRGTGWVWNDERGWLVATNHHVIRGASYFTITFGNGTKAVLRLVGSDALSDLALLKVSAVISGRDLPPALRSAPNCKPRNGEEVVSIGYPSPASKAAGNIPPWAASYGRFMDSPLKNGAFSKILQLDNNIIGGFSGGPTLSLSCGVIGVNVMKNPPRIISQSTFEPVLQNLLTHGRVPRGFLGVEILSIEDGLASGWFIENGYSPSGLPLQGILIAKVFPGLPAETAGLRTGDVILWLDDRRMSDTRDMQRYISGLEPGENVKVTLRRNGKEITLDVKVGTRSDSGKVGARPDNDK